MTDIFLRSRTLAFLQSHRGIGNAVPRDIVLAHLHQWDEKISDRELRATYSEMPEVLSCDHGLFLAESTSDIQAFEQYMRKKAIPFFERVRRVREAHPLLAPGDDVQGGLF